MATIFDLDFETGDSLATLGFTGVSDISNQSGEGLGGSTWGVRGNAGATSGQKYFGEAVLPVTHTGRMFSVSVDVDHVDSGNNGSGYGLFEFRRGVTDWMDLQHGIGAGADRSRLELYTYNSQASILSPTGIVTPGTTQTVVICGEMSSALGVADGSVRVTVDGVVVPGMDLTNWIVGPDTGAMTWTNLFINPMGRFDNLLGTDEGCATTSPVPTNQSTPCCAAPNSPPSGGGVGVVVPPPGTGATMPSFQFQPLQPWTRSCGTGGLPPTAPDEVDSEVWA